MIPAPAKSIDAFACSPAISVIVMFGWSRGHRGVRDSILGAGAIGLRLIHSHKELKLDVTAQILQWRGHLHGITNGKNPCVIVGNF
jgi:hypothetical protein